MAGKCNGKCDYVTWDRLNGEEGKLFGADGKGAFDAKKDITADDPKCLKFDRKKTDDEVKKELEDKITARMKNENGFASTCSEKECRECKSSDFIKLLRPVGAPMPFSDMLEWKQTFTINDKDVECMFTAKGTLMYQKSCGSKECAPTRYPSTQQRITEGITLISHEEQTPEVVRKIRELVTENQEDALSVERGLELGEA